MPHAITPVAAAAAASSALAAVLLAGTAAALDNGLARLPPMGYSSWFDGTFFDPSGCLSPTQMQNTLDAFVSTGLRSAGYSILGMDCYWTTERNWTSWELVPRPDLFDVYPGGMRGWRELVESYGMRAWGYLDRGTALCSMVNGTGSLGYESVDADFLSLSVGVDFVKEDSCAASQDPQTAFEQYARMRDALNSTGRAIIFSLCGWAPFYAPVGESLGNMWRIGPDAASWSAILTNIDQDAPLAKYAGPGGWNDPDMLGGSVWGPLTSLQRRAQFTIYSMLAAPLVLSVNVRNLSAYDLETYTNEEVIAVDQDPLGRQGARLVGGDLERTSATARLRVRPWRRGEALALDGPSVGLQPCLVNATDPARGLVRAQQWILTNGSGLTNILQSALPYADGPGGLCMGVDDCMNDGGAVIGWPCAAGVEGAAEGAEGGFGAEVLESVRADGGRPLYDGEVGSLEEARRLCLADDECAAVTVPKVAEEGEGAEGGPMGRTRRIRARFLGETLVGGPALRYTERVPSTVTLVEDPGWTTVRITWPLGLARPHARRVAEKRMKVWSEAGKEGTTDQAAPGRASPAPIAEGIVGGCCPDGSSCNLQWAFAADGSLRSYLANKTECLTNMGEGQAVLVTSCPAQGAGSPSPAQLWYQNGTDGSVRPGSPSSSSSDMCLTYAGVEAVNIFGKPLSTGAFALAAINAGSMAPLAAPTCDFATCLGPATAWDATQKLMVRDLWARAWLPNITAGQGWTFPALEPEGGVSAVVLTPYW